MKVFLNIPACMSFGNLAKARDFLCSVREIASDTQAIVIRTMDVAKEGVSVGKILNVLSPDFQAKLGAVKLKFLPMSAGSELKLELT